MIKQIASDKLFKQLDHLESGTLEITTPDGHTRTFEGKKPGEAANIELRDWSVLTNMLRKGDIGFADDYRSGQWETRDLTALLNLGLKNKKSLDKFVLGNRLFRTFSMLSYLLRLNTLKGSKKNIHAHYDLGNDFYKLWLDPSMTYSSAIYKKEGENLLDAQHNKYDRITEHLNSKSGSILEIGCGWGGFAERAMEKGDYDIKGITLSEEQHDFATQRLGQRAKIALEDYRHQEKKFDHIVSIEMFEAVGEQYWKTYFNQIKQSLNEKGKAIVQTITMNDRDFPRYRRGGDFIRSFIFPGGMLPSPSRFKEEAEKAGLKFAEPFFFGQDYATTLKEWLDSFDSKRDEILNLGFDEGFIRLWRFYLAACIAGFKTERTNVMQIELEHA